MEDNHVKTICLVAFFLISVIFGCLPYFLVGGRGRRTSIKSARLRAKIISYLNCFAGGVFLGACLLHLMVEGRETFEAYMELIESDIEFPIYECLMASGFFLIALVENLAHKCLEKAVTSSSSIDDEMLKQSSGDGLSPVVVTVMDGDVNQVDSFPASGGVVNGAFVKGPRPPASPRRLTAGPRLAAVPESGPCTNSDMELDASEAARAMATRRGSQASAQVSVPKMEDEDEAMLRVMQVKPIRAFLLLGAFSFHTIFDGMAVGLQTDQSSVLQMFLAISIHKTLVSLCLGLQLFLVWTNNPGKAIFSIIVFSFISPAGVGIGMAVSSININVYAQTLCRAVLEGISTGTFLYVAFFEILHKELGEKKGLFRLLLCALGFIGTAVPKFFHGEE